MLDIRTPPVFHGEQGKDDLPAFLHDLCAWYYTTKGAFGLSGRQLFELISYQAFPFRSIVYEWFKPLKLQILAETLADTQDVNAFLTHTVRAVSKEFEFLTGDKENMLYSMELQASESIAAFVMRFHTLALEAEVRESRALCKLILAVRTHATDFVVVFTPKPSLPDYTFDHIFVRRDISYDI